MGNSFDPTSAPPGRTRARREADSIPHEGPDLRMIRPLVKTYREAYANLPREVWILSWMLFVNRSGTMVLPFLALYCTNELDFSPSEAGRLLSIYGIGAVAGSYVGGKFSSIFGARQVLVASLFLAVPAYLVLLLGRTPTQLSLFLLGASVILEAFRPACVTATTEACEASLHPRALGLNRLALNLGMSIGAATGGFLATVDYRILFYVDATTSGLGGLVLFVLFRRHAKGMQTTPRIFRPDDPKERHPLRDGQFLAVLALLLLVSLVFFQMLGTYALYLRDHHDISESEYGLLFAINTLIIVLVEMVLIHKIQGFNRLRTIGWGFFLTCAGFGILPFGSGLGFCAFTVVIWSFGEMLMMPLTSAYVAARSGSRNRGVYMGYYTMCFSVGTVAAPALGTTLYEISPNLVWYFALGVGLVTLLGCSLLASWQSRDHSPRA